MQSRSLLGVVKQAGKDFSDDECPLRAAALSYYTVFAMPPLLILLITIAGLVWDPQDVQRAMETQFAGLVGSQGAGAIHEMIASADRPGGGNILKMVLSVAGLLFGATGAFIALQGALNRAWEVKPDPEQGGIKNFITKRLLSIGMVLGIGFLLAVSMALTAGISAVGGRLAGGVAEPVMYVIELVASFAVLTVLFAAIYKVLPDAEIGWRDVWVGAIVTGFLFVAGKFALGFYLGRSEPGSAFGAAGALAVILVWVYYAGMILLFGAEFTQRWAESRGRGIRPEEGAVRVEEQEVERPAAAAKGGRDTDPDRKRRQHEESGVGDRAARTQREIVHAASRPAGRTITPARARRDVGLQPARGVEVRPTRGGNVGADGDGGGPTGRLVERVADRALLLAIGGILVKRVLADIKQPRPEPEPRTRDNAQERGR
jgi:membrane protein